MDTPIGEVAASVTDILRDLWTLPILLGDEVPGSRATFRGALLALQHVMSVNVHDHNATPNAVDHINYLWQAAAASSLSAQYEEAVQFMHRLYRNDATLHVQPHDDARRTLWLRPGIVLGFPLKRRASSHRMHWLADPLLYGQARSATLEAVPFLAPNTLDTLILTIATVAEQHRQVPAAGVQRLPAVAALHQQDDGHTTSLPSTPNLRPLQVDTNSKTMFLATSRALVPLTRYLARSLPFRPELAALQWDRESLYELLDAYALTLAEAFESSATDLMARHYDAVARLFNDVTAGAVELHPSFQAHQTAARALLGAHGDVPPDVLRAIVTAAGAAYSPHDVRSLPARGEEIVVEEAYSTTPGTRNVGEPRYTKRQFLRSLRTKRAGTLVT